jgi:hypothetical protein
MNPSCLWWTHKTAELLRYHWISETPGIKLQNKNNLDLFLHLHFMRLSVNISCSDVWPIGRAYYPDRDRGWFTVNELPMGRPNLLQLTNYTTTHHALQLQLTGQIRPQPPHNHYASLLSNKSCGPTDHLPIPALYHNTNTTKYIQG